MSAPVALAFRIAGSIAELKQNLAEAKSQIETTKQAMQRMANSLDGSRVIADANAMAKAIADIGGVTRLTDAEQKRVNATVTEALAKYAALGKEAPAALYALQAQTSQVVHTVEQLPAAVEKTASTFDQMVSQVQASALGFVSAQAIIGTVQGSFRALTAFVAGSVESYASAESAAKRMTVALQQQGTATPQTIDSFNDLATQFQRTTVYSDDLVNQMQALLTEVGNVAPSEMGKALTAATDLASGLGIDLQQATMLVGKAFAGETGTLKKFGIVVDEARVAAEGVPAVLDAIQQKFGGQAAAEAETYAGRIKQIANEWDNLKEAVGKAIVTDPRIEELLDYLQGRVTGIGDSAEQYQPTITDWWARLAGGQYAGAAVGYLNSVDQAIRDINAGLAKAPAAPKAFQVGDGGLMAGMKKEADDFFKKTLEGWAKADKAAEQYKAKVEASFRKFSGADAAEEARVLDSTLRRLTDSGKVTKQQLEDIGTAAAKVAGDGATLSPRLWDVVMATGALNPKVLEGAGNFAELGTKIDIATPKLSAFVQASAELQGKVKDSADGIGDLGFKVSSGFEAAAKATKKQKDTVDELARAFAQLSQVAGGSLGDLVRDLGTIVAAADTAKKSIAAISQGAKGGGLDGILSMTSGVMGLASAALSAGKAIASLFNRSKGRDLVEDFAKSMGGFDALQAKLQALDAQGGTVGAELWRSLTQGVGRNNPEEAKKAIEAVQAALEKVPPTMSQLAEQAGFATRDHLQQVATDAVKLWDYMRDSGQYSADQVEQAWQRAQASLGAAGAAELSTLQAAYDAAKKNLDGLDQEIASLQKSIDSEAPEEVMGVVEAQARARLAALQQERDAAAKHVEDVQAQLTDSMTRVADALTQLPTELAVRVRVELETHMGGAKPIPQADGGDWLVTRPTLFLAGEAGPERATFAPVGKGGAPGGAGTGRIEVPVIIDGREVARAVKEHLPGEFFVSGLR